MNMKTAEQLDHDILALIAQGLDRPDDAQFNRLALELFEYQFARNQPYRNFCRARRVEPATITSWRDIPAVPASAFKEAALACFPIERAAAVFETSGTTQSAAKRGRHYLETTELYHASIIPNFAAHLLADGAKPPMLMLTPSPEEAPNSSLSHMMGVVAEAFGARGRHYFVEAGKLQPLRLCDTLRMAEGFEQPVMLLGTAFAFVHFFEWCEENHQYFRLPAGSRAMETGGFKGKTRELTKAELHELFAEYLLMPADHVVNEYGMTELGVQFYDRVGAHGRAPMDEAATPTKAHRRAPLHTAPPWSRVVIVDPATGNEVAEGQRGLIRVFDLTNRSSVMAIQTEDIGVRIGEGFEVLGRAAGAEARGCSIAADEFLAANGRE
jgi:hypothetical protein